MTGYPLNMAIHPQVTAFFDAATNTISYVVKDPASNACAVIDLTDRAGLERLAALEPG